MSVLVHRNQGFGLMHGFASYVRRFVQGTRVLVPTPRGVGVDPLLWFDLPEAALL